MNTESNDATNYYYCGEGLRGVPIYSKDIEEAKKYEENQKKYAIQSISAEIRRLTNKLDELVNK